jgi:predicted amidohydrolase
MKAALIQLNSSDDPGVNLSVIRDFVAEAARRGADFILTPEVANCVSTSRSHQNRVLQHEEEDDTLAALRADAKALGRWLLIGSLGIKTHDADERFANRSFLIAPDGEIAARYDKIHMFDVDISETERFQESEGYRPGDRAVLADSALGKIGLSICYDMRFATLYRRLAQAGAQIITVPAAFSPVTGAAHWESLLRTRAIETGCYILAPAQCGRHAASRGQSRGTWGHSLAVAPWGEVLADGGDAPGVTLVDIDLAQVDEARRRVPSLRHDREFEGP